MKPHRIRPGDSLGILSSSAPADAGFPHRPGQPSLNAQRQMLGGTVGGAAAWLGSVWVSPSRKARAQDVHDFQFCPDWRDALFSCELPEERPFPARLGTSLGAYATMGVCERMAGVVGRLYRPSANDGDLVFEVIGRRTALRRVPVLAECNFGRTDSIFPSPIGMRARRDTNERHLLEAVAA